MFGNLKERSPKVGDHVLVYFDRGTESAYDPSSPNWEPLMVDEAIIIRRLGGRSYRVYSPAVDDAFTVDKSAIMLVDN